jgi:PBSX family phage terminase large subunit
MRIAMLKWTDKQREYLREAIHRWNFKVGAVRSGKTFQDKEHLIPYRIRERIGKDGIVLLVGVTEATLERNVLRPMRDKFGHQLVGRISQNKVWLFGEECYALGAEKINQVSKIQGSSIKYCYGDEVAKWHRDVFDIIKSRLDQDYSLFDGTCNPEQANHWLKAFLESDADIYCQHYIIDDNTYLSKTFIENLKKEYAGTVYYDRYILGLWVNAEGIIYRKFADNPDRYKIKYECSYDENRRKWIDNLPRGETIIGIDYGGTKSGQAFVCTRISNDYRKIIVLASKRIIERLDDEQLLKQQLDFIEYCMTKFHTNIDYVYPDNESSTHIRSLDNAVTKKGWDTIVRGSKKEEILTRIECQNKMLSFDIFYYLENECDSLVSAMKEALWNSKIKSAEGKDERLDDFSTDIDSLDAYEYTYERYIKRIIDAINMEAIYDV